MTDICQHITDAWGLPTERAIALARVASELPDGSAILAHAIALSREVLPDPCERAYWIAGRLPEQNGRSVEQQLLTHPRGLRALRNALLAASCRP